MRAEYNDINMNIRVKFLTCFTGNPEILIIADYSLTNTMMLMLKKRKNEISKNYGGIYLVNQLLTKLVTNSTNWKITLVEE